MRVRVNPELCQGHGLCHFEAPDVFGLDDGDGSAYVLDPEPPAEQERAAMRAEQGCPERAITIA